jgi:hypothetical protein
LVGSGARVGLRKAVGTTDIRLLAGVGLMIIAPGLGDGFQNIKNMATAIMNKTINAIIRILILFIFV